MQSTHLAIDNQYTMDDAHKETKGIEYKDRLPTKCGIREDKQDNYDRN